MEVARLVLYETWADVCLEQSIMGPFSYQPNDVTWYLSTKKLSELKLLGKLRARAAFATLHFLTYKWARYARVFVPSKPFQSSKM
jgi:hypothetical protein